MNTETTALQDIGELIRSQDNRATSDPLFLVQQRKRIYGLNLDHAEDSVWLHCDGVEADEDEADELDAQNARDEVPEEWELVGILDQWEFVTACFTEQACKDYIEANKHNLNEPRIYAATLYRNREMIEVRNALKSNELG